MYEESLWVEKYRPRKIDDCILTDKNHEFFSNLVRKRELPNLLLDGGAGCGKTTVAKALCDDLGYDYLMINASESGNIDTLRTLIKDFASTMSFDEDDKKVVILDEADYLNPQSTQPALRGFMEEYTSNARFILTCNYKGRILEPLQSRCSSVSFKIPADERATVAKRFYVRLKEILKAEEVEFDDASLMQLLKMHFPDFRKTINALDAYAKGGMNLQEILVAIKHTPISELVTSMKAKDFTKAIEWIENTEMDGESFYEEWNKMGKTIINPKSYPEFFILLAEYDAAKINATNPDINKKAFVAAIMSECELT